MAKHDDHGMIMVIRFRHSMIKRCNMIIVWPSWSDKKFEEDGQKNFLTFPYLFIFVSLQQKKWVALMTRVALRKLIGNAFPEVA